MNAMTRVDLVPLAAPAVLLVSALAIACGGSSTGTRETTATAKSGKAPESADELENVEASAYEFYRSVSKTLLRTNQPLQASRTIRRLFKLKPESPEPYFLMGEAYVAMRHFDAALKMLQTAIEKDPKYAEAHSILGVTLNMLGRHRQADLSHRKAIELDQNNASYHNNLGFSLYLQGLYSQAVQSYQAALQRDPGARRVHNNLGFAYGKVGKEREAYESFKLAGLPAQASNNMGFVQESKGRLEEAYDYYLAAVNQDPELLQARRNLERVCKRLGRPIPDVAVTIKNPDNADAEPPAESPES
jgi:Flp pilus assembly protein TadD